MQTENATACEWCEGHGKVRAFGQYLDHDPRTIPCHHCDGTGKTTSAASPVQGAASASEIPTFERPYVALAQVRESVRAERASATDQGAAVKDDLNKPVQGDAIAKCKRIMALVDDYVASEIVIDSVQGRSTTRRNLRLALMAEFEHAALAESAQAQPSGAVAVTVNAIAREIFRTFRPSNMVESDWDSEAVLGRGNALRSKYVAAAKAVKKLFATPAPEQEAAPEPIGFISAGVIEHALAQGMGASAYIQAVKTAEFPVAIYAAPAEQEAAQVGAKADPDGKFAQGMLASLARAGASPAGLSLAAQLFGVGPCTGCGYRKLYCRCATATNTNQPEGEKGGAA